MAVLKCIATVLAPIEPGLVVMVLRHLPGVEVARLACVHKVFAVALNNLRQQHPGPRYDAPTADDLRRAQVKGRFVVAGLLGDSCSPFSHD